jgi:histone acetyltransferase (RNA polymerase elongator complex component)
VEEALRHTSRPEMQWEIAFFGGSFTAVEEAYQTALLEAAAPYVRKGIVQGVRISTRPDAIDETILCRLKGYGVTAIELGAQSMSDAVLKQNQRGHTAQQVRQASQAIRKLGFSLGLQMMVGLDGDTLEGAFDTARELAELRPDTMRIYPTVVLSHTPLARRFLRGEYQPMKLEEAMDLCADLLDFFETQEIAVIRLGLHSSPELEENRLAGPWHPAFRELCDSRRFFKRLTAYLQEKHPKPAAWKIRVHPSWISKAVGQKQANRKALAALGYPMTFISDPAVPPLAFVLQDEERSP